MVASTAERPGREGQSHQIVSGDDERRFAIGSDLHDAAPPIMRCRDIKIVVNVHGNPLRTSQPAIELADFAVRIDLMNGVEAGSGRAR